MDQTLPRVGEGAGGQNSSWWVEVYQERAGAHPLGVGKEELPAAPLGNRGNRWARALLSKCKREAGEGSGSTCRGGGPTPAARHVPSPPPRLSPKHRDGGRKTGSQRSSGSRSPSPSGGSGWGSPQQNGGNRQRSGAHGSRPGSAHSPPDVRTLRFAEGSRAVCGLRRAGWGGHRRAGRGECLTGEGGSASPSRLGNGLECLVVAPTWP